jgi:hypothetical protein
VLAPAAAAAATEQIADRGGEVAAAGGLELEEERRGGDVGGGMALGAARQRGRHVLHPDPGGGERQHGLVCRAEPLGTLRHRADQLLERDRREVPGGVIFRQREQLVDAVVQRDLERQAAANTDWLKTEFETRSLRTFAARAATALSTLTPDFLHTASP